MIADLRVTSALDKMLDDIEAREQGRHICRTTCDVTEEKYLADMVYYSVQAGNDRVVHRRHTGEWSAVNVDRAARS